MNHISYGYPTTTAHTIPLHFAFSFFALLFAVIVCPAHSLCSVRILDMSISEAQDRNIRGCMLYCNKNRSSGELAQSSSGRRFSTSKIFKASWKNFE